MADPGPSLDSRLRRVEEACAFAQNDADQLSTEVAELGRRLAAAVRRLDAMERRLAESDNPIDATPTPPPHSAPPQT